MRAPVARAWKGVTAFQWKDAPKAFGPRGANGCQMLNAGESKNSIPIFGRPHKEKILASELTFWAPVTFAGRAGRPGVRSGLP
jgi:hypothetical protein